MVMGQKTTRSARNCLLISEVVMDVEIKLQHNKEVHIEILTGYPDTYEVVIDGLSLTLNLAQFNKLHESMSEWFKYLDT